MKTFVDQCGRTISLAATPQRIVCLVPSITELLVDLGLEEHIVGITKFCVHPYRLKSTKTIVGGTKKLHFDRVRELRPDIIIANKEENTPEIVDEFSKDFPVWVSDIATLSDNEKMIEAFGEIFNCRTASSKIIGKINHAKADFDAFISNFDELRCAYLIWKNPYMAAGSGTYINEMMNLCKFSNIYANRERYPEIIIQKMRIQGDPEAVFLSSEPYPFKEEDAFEVGRYTHHAKVTFVDGEMFSWYGSRAAKAFGYFKKLRERLA